jgi:hypothetical protein
MDQGMILALLVFIYPVAKQAPRAVVNGEIDRSQFRRTPVQDWHLFFPPEEICNHGTALDDMYFNMITFFVSSEFLYWSVHCACELHAHGSAANACCLGDSCVDRSSED